MKWNVDRSSPEDKLLDILEWMKSAKKDIRHQVTHFGMAVNAR